METKNPLFVRRALVFTLAVACVAMHTTQLRAQVTHKTILCTEYAAPGLPEARFLSLRLDDESRALNNSGEIAIFGQVVEGVGSGSQITSCVWRGPADALEVVARSGPSGPGVEELDFVSFGGTADPSIAINELGHVLFRAGVASTSAMRHVLVFADDSGNQLVAQSGTIVPDISGATFDNFLDAAIGPNNTVAFSGLLEFGGGVVNWNRTGLWHGYPHDMRLAVRASDPAPNRVGGVFSSSPYWTHITQSGDAVFRMSLDVGTGDVTAENNENIYIYSPSAGVDVIVDEGQPAPSVGGALFSSPGRIAANLGSDFAFVGRLNHSHPSVNTINNYAIWVYREGDLELVAREGTPAPGFPEGRFLDNFIVPALSNRGEVAFAASVDPEGEVTAGDNHGIWAEVNGQLKLLVSSGSVAPGTGGAIFAGFSRPSINTRGDVVFDASLVDGIAGVDFRSRYGVWAYDGMSGELRLVLRMGDTIDVNDDPIDTDIRTVGDIRNYERTIPFNDLGMCLITITFEGGQGVFLFQLPGYDCLPDTNHDGTLSPADFSAWVAAFNASAPECDQNGDSSCSPADFSAWVANYNAGC